MEAELKRKFSFVQHISMQLLLFENPPLCCGRRQQTGLHCFPRLDYILVCRKNGFGLDCYFFRIQLCCVMKLTEKDSKALNLQEKYV